MRFWPSRRLFETLLDNQEIIVDLLQTIDQRTGELMSIQDDLVAAVTRETNAANAAKQALAALQSEVSSLQAQANSEQFDANVIASQIAALGSSADDLAAAIPANTQPAPQPAPAPQDSVSGATVTGAAGNDQMPVNG